MQLTTTDRLTNGSINQTLPKPIRLRRLPAKKAKHSLPTRERDWGQFWLQVIASLAAAIIPVTTYMVAHVQLAQFDLLNLLLTWQGSGWLEFCRELPALALIAAGLAYSAPTVASWAYKWTDSGAKAWSFTALLEGAMTFAHVPIMPFVCLVWLAGINLLVAAKKSGRLKARI